MHAPYQIRIVRDVLALAATLIVATVLAVPIVTVTLLLFSNTLVTTLVAAIVLLPVVLVTRWMTIGVLRVRRMKTISSDLVDALRDIPGRPVYLGDVEPIFEYINQQSPGEQAKRIAALLEMIDELREIILREHDVHRSIYAIDDDVDMAEGGHGHITLRYPDPVTLSTAAWVASAFSHAGRDQSQSDRRIGAGLSGD